MLLWKLMMMVVGCRNSRIRLGYLEELGLQSGVKSYRKEIQRRRGQIERLYNRIGEMAEIFWKFDQKS